MIRSKNIFSKAFFLILTLILPLGLQSTQSMEVEEEGVEPQYLKRKGISEEEELNKKRIRSYNRDEDIGECTLTQDQADIIAREYPDMARKLIDENLCELINLDKYFVGIPDTIIRVLEENRLRTEVQMMTLALEKREKENQYYF